MFDWFVSVFDAVSQFFGRLIFVRVDGKWTTYTRNANESISGASNWHADNGRWPWVEKLIDFVFWFISFGIWEKHCLEARINDRSRAGELLASEKPKREL